MEILDDFNKFKEYLHSKVIVAEKMGLSDQTIAKGVSLVQGFLSRIIDPHNPEERLLQHLWRVGNDEEREALSKMVLKVVKDEDNTKNVQKPKH